MIGVFVTQAASVKLPIKVEINAGDVVGPSAGLAFALELTEKLSGKADRGYKVAATGELALDGSVEPIGGVEQKVIGAKRAGIEIMLVPAGENMTEARRYAGDMKIIAVTSFQQALHALATLPLHK
jgi:PDZ domain-containing protein